MVIASVVSRMEADSVADLYNDGRVVLRHKMNGKPMFSAAQLGEIAHVWRLFVDLEAVTRFVRQTAVSSPESVAAQRAALDALSGVYDRFHLPTLGAEGDERGAK